MTDLLLAGARVITPDEDLPEAWVAIADGRVAAVGQGAPPAAADTVDLGGRLVVPGFVDLHVHGGGGAQFMGGDPDACRRAARFHAEHGTTGMLATTMSAPRAELLQALRGIVAAMPDAPTILGCHLEGPWLSGERRGAQDPAHLRPPDVGELGELLKAGAGTVRVVSLAPELPGAPEVIEAIAAAGAIPALAHTDATYAQAEAGIAAGARHALHVFNGMRPLHHREPGVVGAVLDSSAVTCEVIADGHHVHPAVIRLLYRAKGATGTVLVTDAIEAAGLPDGRYRLGTAVVSVTGGRTETADGHLAGSTLTLDAAVRNAHRWLDVPLATAVALASTTPARVLGLGARKGRIAPGHDADLVVLNDELEPLATLVRGRWLDRRPPP